MALKQPGFAPLSLLVGSHEEPSLLAEAAPKMNLFRKEQLLARRRPRSRNRSKST